MSIKRNFFNKRKKKRRQMVHSTILILSTTLNYQIYGYSSCKQIKQIGIVTLMLQNTNQTHLMQIQHQIIQTPMTKQISYVNFEKPTKTKTILTKQIYSTSVQNCKINTLSSSLPVLSSLKIFIFNFQFSILIFNF